MGKPSSSSSSLLKRSLNISSSNMNTQKITKKKKKRRNKTQKNIQKLFQKLRDESQSSSTSVIDLDDTQNNTVIYRDGSYVVLDDDITQTPTATPRKNMYMLTSSTPNQKTLDNLILNESKAQIPKDQSLIDLTTETEDQTVIDLADTTDNDCMFVTVSTANSMDSDITVINMNKGTNSKNEPNMSDSECSIVNNSPTKKRDSMDSNITVLNIKKRKTNSKNKPNTSNNMSDSECSIVNNSTTKRDMRKFANGIANLNASEKGKLLELITQQIFSGCNVPTDLKTSLADLRQTIEGTNSNRGPLTPRRNSIGSNIYHPDKPINKTGLRMIVIDGSNVAMEHGRGRVFSVKGLNICIDYFVKKGHNVKAFVPRFRCKYGKSSNPHLLDRLERQGYVIYTPSREIQGRMIASYDDRYIIQCAAEFDGVIVTGDNYRDLINENPRWRFIIENRLLPFTWVQDMIMFPKDPLGRNGPTLQEFLKM